MPRVRHVPERQCLACRRRAPKRELLRLVRTPEDVVEVDPQGRKAGRGAYICSREECWMEIAKKTCLDRALRCTVSDQAIEQLLSYYNERLRPSIEGETT